MHKYSTNFQPKRTKVDGHIFGSRGEAKRYQELKLFERAGKISNLTLQPKFEFWVNGEYAWSWSADFQYNLPNVTLPVVEDFKGGKITPEHKRSSRLFQILYKGKYHYVETGPSARKTGARRKRRRVRTRT